MRERRNEEQEEQKSGKKIGVQWLFLIPLVFVCVMIVMLLLPREDKNLSYLSAEHSVQNAAPTSDPRKEAWANIAGVSEGMYTTLGERVIVLPKSIGTEVTVWKDDYVRRQVHICITGYTGEEFSVDALQGVYGDEYKQGLEALKMNGSEAVLEGCSVQTDEKDGVKTLTLMFEESTVYECRIQSDQNYYFLSWYRPAELYDKIVVLDAGHGGEDLGAVAPGGKVYEKNVVLTYLLGIKELADAQDEIKFYYTRTEDKNCSEDYSEGLTLRTDLVANVEADLFLSLHLNSNESKNFHGTEMYYNGKQDSWETFHSKQFAEILMEKVTEALGLHNNGYVEASETLSMVKYSTAPVTLAELGYISNADDFAVLMDEERQAAVEKALFEAIQEAFVRMDAEAKTID